MEFDFDNFKDVYANFKKQIQDQSYPTKELHWLNKMLATLIQNPDIWANFTKEQTEYFNVEFLFGLVKRILDQKSIISQDVSFLSFST